MPQYLLGIDNGCTVSKAALFTTTGEEIAVASRKSEMIAPQPGYTERNVDELWQTTAEAIRAVVQQAGVDPAQIACVASAGHGNGLYLIDERGAPVCNGILSMDNRAQEYVDRWTAEGVAEDVLPKTTQSLWAAQPNALLAWLRDHQPEVIRRARWVLMCKDYIRYRLCGQIHAELTDFSGTSLMNVVGGRYDDELLEAFGIAEMRPLLPPLVRSEAICGEVTAEAAAATGLAEGTPVAGGLFDIDACGLATGLVDPSQMCMIAGTWGCNQYIWNEPVVSDEIFMTSRYCMPGYYLVLEGSATSASNLEWFVSEFFQAERAAAEEQGRSVFELVNQLVADVPPEQSNIVFLPFLFGSNSDPKARASLVGLGNWHRRGHVLRAVYEGIVFSHMTHVRRLLKFRDLPQSILLTGGAARSEVWVQIFADAFQIPVELPSGTELGALGAAICAGVACGVYPDYRAAVEAMVQTTRVQRPNPALADLYAAKYDRYQRVLDALGPVWPAMQ